jgi:formylglycine-generating enzyme required for sulfatase activity
VGREGSYIPDGEQVFPVERFMIAKYPVTVRQFRTFMLAGDGYQDARWWDYSDQARRWREAHNQPQKAEWGGPPDHPRVNVTWFEAVAFCRWLSEQVDYQVRLPTEQEWQRAAQGDDGRAYPWGEQAPTDWLANFDDNVRKTTPVGSYPKGASPYGVLDAAGNVWEWCSTDYQTGNYDIGLDAEERVLRGGSWESANPNFMRVASRGKNKPSNTNNRDGFRIARSI